MPEKTITWELSREHCPYCGARFNKVGVIFKNGDLKRVKVSHKKVVLGKPGKNVFCLNCGKKVELSTELNHLRKRG